MLRIITDSASDLPKEIIERYQVLVIPTPVVIDQVDYLDGETIYTKEFYDILDDVERDVRTYHINPDMFEKVFLPLAQQGDQVIYLCFSTGIAGTYNSANIARENILEEYPDFDLTIVDSKCASVGFGLLVWKLLVMQENGASKEELLKAADFYVAHIRHVFTVQTLAYLIKGGRLSKFKGTVAEAFNIKPVLIVDGDGSLQMLRTVHGRKKSIHALIDFVKERGVDLREQTVAFCHGEDEEGLKEALKLADQEIRPKDKLISTVGCAIGAHTGRGIIGICFLDASEKEFSRLLGQR